MCFKDDEFGIRRSKTVPNFTIEEVFRYKQKHKQTIKHKSLCKHLWYYSESSNDNYGFTKGDIHQGKLGMDGCPIRVCQVIASVLADGQVDDPELADKMDRLGCGLISRIDFRYASSLGDQRHTSYFKFCRTDPAMLHHDRDLAKSFNYLCPDTCGCNDDYAEELANACVFDEENSCVQQKTNSEITCPVL